MLVEVVARGLGLDKAVAVGVVAACRSLVERTAEQRIAHFGIGAASPGRGQGVEKQGINRLSQNFALRAFQKPPRRRIGQRDLTGGILIYHTLRHRLKQRPESLLTVTQGRFGSFALTVNASWAPVATVDGLTPGTLGAIVASPVAPVAAAPDGRTGLSAPTAGTSCWSIKQSYPSSADGIYWLWTPKLVAPQQFYCDMTTDGGGWVLIGRGREGWSFPYWGQGSPSTVRNTVNGAAAFEPATLPTPTVNGLLNGGRMDALADGIRLRRATNAAGTSWQEVREIVAATGTWTWGFGGGIPLSSMSVDGVSTTFATSTYRTNTTADARLADHAAEVL